jgi:hypothetical protein
LSNIMSIIAPLLVGFIVTDEVSFLQNCHWPKVMGWNSLYLLLCSKLHNDMLHNLCCSLDTVSV